MDPRHPYQNSTHAIFLIHAKILHTHTTHATHAKVWPTQITIFSKLKPELPKTFNSHYIIAVKTITGKHPTKLGPLASRISKKEMVATITDKSKIHPSIRSIKNEFRPTAELKNIKLLQSTI